MQIKLLYPGLYKAAASVACLVFPSAGVILHFSLLSYAEKKNSIQIPPVFPQGTFCWLLLHLEKYFLRTDKQWVINTKNYLN